MNLNDQLAKEIIRERSTREVVTRRPTHPRTAKVLRRLADRLEQTR
jgi:hypothetical protein